LWSSATAAESEVVGIAVVAIGQPGQRQPDSWIVDLALCEPQSVVAEAVRETFTPSIRVPADPSLPESARATLASDPGALVATWFGVARSPRRRSAIVVFWGVEVAVADHHTAPLRTKSPAMRCSCSSDGRGAVARTFWT